MLYSSGWKICMVVIDKYSYLMMDILSIYAFLIALITALYLIYNAQLS